MTSHPDTLRWFPLVARPRPACPRLTDRLTELSTLLRRAKTAPSSEALNLAAVVHNKAALIASDCGLPELAETLCRQQLQLHQRAQPLEAGPVRHALEPVVNLARLAIRAGYPDHAHHLLTDLLDAAKTGGSLTVAGHTVDLGHLMTTDARPATVQWLWTVVLADGTRALTSAGRWSDALTVLRRHSGIGDRLLDGRQTAVIAHHLAGDHDQAQCLLATSQPHEPWEHPVRLTLELLGATTSTTQAPDRADLTSLLDQAAHGPEFVVFRTRLILAAADLIAAAGASPHQLIRTLHRDPAVTADGYAARDVLNHPTIDLASSTEREVFTTAVHTAGLDGSLEPRQLRTLLDTTRGSESLTREHLTGC